MAQAEDLKKGAEQLNKGTLLGRISSYLAPKKKETPKPADTWKPPRRKVPYYDEPNQGMKTPQKQEAPKRAKRSGKY